jgi:hypothetical protein
MMMNKTEIEIKIENLKIEKDLSIKQQDYLKATELSELIRELTLELKSL